MRRQAPQIDKEGARRDDRGDDRSKGGILAEHDSIDSAPPEKAPRIIKRYSNRKLYDTDESRYVTLLEISEMIKEGIEVRIIDNNSKEDLTTVTLAQIIYEEEKKTSKMPIFVLKEIIRNGGGKIHAFIADEVNPRVSAIRAEAEHAVARVFRREGEAAPGVKKPNPLEQAKEFVSSSRLALEDWQGSLDESLHRVMKTVVGLPNLHREVQALRDKLGELEKKLEEHERGE